MNEPVTVLVVDDQAPNRKLLGDLLSGAGYLVRTANNGEECLALLKTGSPDLVLLDVVMPGMSGYDVCRAIRAMPGGGVLPVVLVTALDAPEEKVRGLDAGADDFLTKPINRPELMARVRSLLRIKHLYDTVQGQTAELALLNAGLESRVAEQLGQLERLGQLKRYFPPQLAEMIVSGDLDDPLRTRRREITVALLDLRGFNAFADTSEPEEVMGLLLAFHREMSRLIHAQGGTLGQFSGRTMQVVFNDPVVVDDPARRAVQMALDMQRCFGELLAGWKKQGYEIELAIGIAQGYATIGTIGDEERSSYGVIGRVVNIAERLCAEAPPGQVLVSAPVRSQVEAHFATEAAEQVNMQGFARPLAVYRVTRAKAAPARDNRDERPVKIRTLGRFSVEIDGRPIEFSRKTQKKPLDMLRVLIAHGCTRVDAGAVTEALWPGAEGDTGKMSFDSNLHRLRKLMNVNDLLVMSEGKLTLELSRCWIDTFALDEVVARVEHAAALPQAGANGGISGDLQELLQLYAGHFLDNETQEAWAVAARDRYKAKFARAVSLIGGQLEGRGEWEQAAVLFSRALELDNLAEPLYRRLMICYRELGEPAEALNAYRRCREMLSIVLGVKPAPETEAIRASMG